MKKVLWVILGAVAIMSLLAAGCGSSSSEDPAERIDNAYKKAMDYKTVHENYEMTLTMDGDASAMGDEFAMLLPLELTISGEGDFDNSDKSNPAMQMTMAIEGMSDIIDNAMAASGGSAADMMDAGMFDDLFGDMEIKLVDNVLYMKLMGEWYESDTAELTSQAGGNVEEVDTACTQDAMQEKLVPSAMLSDIEEVGDEDVDGESTTHYKAKVDVGKITDVSTEIAKECNQEDAAAELETGGSQLSDMFETLDVELWIDGDDNVRKVKMDVDLDTGTLTGFEDVEMDAYQSDAMASLIITVSVTMTQSGFDEDVNIEAPTDAKPMEDLLDAFGSLGGFGTGFEDVEDMTGDGFDDVGTTTDDETETSTTSSTTTNPFST